MKLRKTVVIDKPLDAVFSYLSDFTTTTDWDPGTVSTVRRNGNGGVGTTYVNTSSRACGRRSSPIPAGAPIRPPSRCAG
jgi:hypothetical protein